MQIRLTFRPALGALVTIPRWGDFTVAALSDDGPAGAAYDVATLDDGAGGTLFVNCATACFGRRVEAQRLARGGK